MNVHLTSVCGATILAKPNEIPNMVNNLIYSYPWCKVRFSPWPGIFFKPARCGYTLRVTSQASYSYPFLLYNID